MSRVLVTAVGSSVFISDERLGCLKPRYIENMADY